MKLYITDVNEILVRRVQSFIDKAGAYKFAKYEHPKGANAKEMTLIIGYLESLEAMVVEARGWCEEKLKEATA